MSQYGNKGGKPSGIDKLNGIPRNIKISSIESQKNFKIEDVAVWTGCFICPDKCLIIKGIYKVYMLYNESLNQQYEQEINNFMKNLSSEFINEGKNLFAKNLVNRLDNNGFINEVSTQTGIDSDIVEVIMEGTVKSLLSQIV